jgi:protein-S-isoprenylcysteine O-methyltransferase Ste14
MFAENRILISRLFALCFLLLFFFAEPKLDDTVWEALLFFVGLLLVGIATVGRLWCSLYISGRKSAELVMDGPYSICRHPLYFFPYLG